MIGQRLKLGDTIGVICPASGEINTNKLEANLNQLLELGFYIKEGRYLRDNNNYLAGSDEHRAKDFMNMFKDKDVNAIICYRGGYGSIRMMKYIDWNVVKCNPKIFCGYSDITILLNYINQVSGLITFHSPMIISNLFEPLTKKYFFNTLMYPRKTYNISLNCFSSIKIFNRKHIRGELCGGNLSLICSSLGTPYEIDTEDKILLIEDIDEAPYNVDRLLTQLLLSNKLHCCKGFIVGYFTPNNCTTNKTIEDILIPLKKPIIMNFPAGHDYPNITLPIGANIAFNISEDALTICEKVVK